MIGVCVVAAIAVVLWVKGRPHRAPSSAKPAIATGSAASSGQPHAANQAPEPARALVTVSDASGPIAGATVRLSHDGDVTTMQTGTDGTARADDLEAGAWQISATSSRRDRAVS